MCGSAPKLATISAPAPVLAITASWGRRSSQLTKSTFTSMPVASMNFLVLDFQYTSSGSMNLAGRSTCSEAPFSILNSGAFTSAVGTSSTAALAPMIGIDAAPSAAAPRARESRREIVMGWFPPFLAALAPCPELQRSAGQPLAVASVEKMHQRRLGRDVDRLARPGRYAFAEGTE